MGQGQSIAAVERDYQLTRLELIGLTVVANGLPATEAATRLCVSEREIETILFCAQRKLRAQNRTHAVAIAIRKGLIGIDL